MAECTLHQLVGCLDELGLDEEQTAEVVMDLLNTRRVHIVNPVGQLLRSPVH